ncbi:MAG: P-loop NTPase fold protein [Patescibacteria group bacterium]
MEKYFTRLKESLTDLRITTANLTVLIRTIFFGVLATEICRISILTTGKIIPLDLENHRYKILVIYVVGFLILTFYLLARDFYANFKKILKSGRLDILIAFSFGIWLSIVWSSHFSGWYINTIAALDTVQLLTIISTPFILGFLVLTRSGIWKRDQIESSLVVDLELEEKNDDLLNFAEKANRFAERIFNGGSPESFVFGVDAPWGIGKSTFINFCQEYWKEKHPSQTIVYKFSPLRHSGTTQLLEVFIDGLIHAIQKDSFVPEIKPLISRYSRLLKEVSRFSLFGFTLPTLSVNYTADEAFNDLNAILRRFDKKIIIVVDDLDRIDFTEIKDILFVIRKSLILPNISYVLCYDTENINALDAKSPETEKIREFLEKFINIKISLYLDRDDLSKYVSENLEKALSTSIVDPLPIRQAIGGLLDIYKSSSYHKYLPFIGDVRKLKRLINTVMMFDLQGTDFKNSDFDKRDLINLLLIYIHYPDVFRKIYDTETNGGRGFFSLVIPHDDGYPPETSGQSRSSFSDSTYKNSLYYHDYLKQFRKDSRQRFLLDEIFNVNVRLKNAIGSNFPDGDRYAQIDNVPDDIRTSLACFNGEWTNGRNLETYLDLIIKLSKPEDVGQHRFYMNRRDQITQGEVSPKSAFADEKFTYNSGESTREKLWRILVNNAHGLKKNPANSIIIYLLESIPEYSLLELKDFGMGLRHDLDYFLTRLLNDAGWIDAAGEHSRNTPENIKEISEWVFGTGRHAENGVLTTLSQSDRGILGVYDLMIFRLACSADRGGDIFNLSRALAQHADEEAPTEGDMRIIAREEMREISQKVFSIFKARYIDPGRNIFDDTAALRIADLASKSNNYLLKKIAEGRIKQSDIDKKSTELKTRVSSFILYQLGNSEISHGVGCGYYDPTGKEDKQVIRGIVNDYLFSICFNPSEPKNVEHLIDYLFRNFASVFASAREDGRKYEPSINEFTKVLDKVKLAEYWQKNSATIKALNLHEKEKIVFVGNDEASYKENVPLIYKVLDDNVTEVAVIPALTITTPTPG